MKTDIVMLTCSPGSSQLAIPSSRAAAWAIQTLAHPEVVKVSQVAQGHASAVASFLGIHQRLGTTAAYICVPKATVQHNLQNRALPCL